MDMKAINARVIEEFRAGGPIEGMQRDRLALLTTTGAKSGRKRTTPLMFNRDGERLLFVASNMGAPSDPDWYRNLIANPRVTVEVDGSHFEADASASTGEEYERLWGTLTEQYPFFLDHEAASNRRIPVVVVTAVG